jgi:hypothetical protein
VPEDCRNITNQDTVIVRMNASMPGQWEKDGSGNAVPIISMTGARLLAALGPGWQLSGGKVTPRKRRSISTRRHCPTSTTMARAA